MEALTLTLLGYPISIMANVTYDKLINLSNSIDIEPLKALLIKSFYKSIDYHNKHYDDYSKKIAKEIRKEVKSDENKLLLIFSKFSEEYGNFISLIRHDEYQVKVADEIVRDYSLELGNYPDLVKMIIAGCLRYYFHAFFNQMNEKEGIQAILIESLKLNDILDILRKIDSKLISLNDFDQLRRTVYSNYLNNNLEAKKNIENFDKYISNKYKYLELRGFSPKISGKEIQMDLFDIFVPLEINRERTILPTIMKDENLIDHKSNIQWLPAGSR